MLALQEAETAGLQVQGLSGPQSNFLTSLGNLVKSCLREKEQPW